MKTKYDTYLLGNEDVLDIYNRLLPSPLITDLESGITSLIYSLFLALVELTTYCFQCLVNYFVFQLHDIGRY